MNAARTCILCYGVLDQQNKNAGVRSLEDGDTLTLTEDRDTLTLTEDRGYTQFSWWIVCLAQGFSAFLML